MQAELLEFDTKSEAWNQYTLEDGTSLKMKLVLLEVVRLLDEYSPSGDPIYTFSAQQIVGVVAPSGLKKKG